MLKYLVARLLDTSKNTYYFLFILTKKVVLHKSPKTLLTKKNIVLSASSCRGMIWHAWKIWFLHSLGMLRHEWGMPRHASLGFLTGRPHAAAWQNHAAACSRDLPNFASFDSFLLVLRSFHLTITYKIKTHIKMPKTGDKQYKTLSI